MVLGGVCAAVSRAIGLDVSVLRALGAGFAALTVGFGFLWLWVAFAAPLVYSIGWLAIPRE